MTTVRMTDQNEGRTLTLTMTEDAAVEIQYALYHAASAAGERLRKAKASKAKKYDGDEGRELRQYHQQQARKQRDQWYELKCPQR
jgi:hypothetical protein